MGEEFEVMESPVPDGGVIVEYLDLDFNKLVVVLRNFDCFIKANITESGPDTLAIDYEEVW